MIARYSGKKRRPAPLSIRLSDEERRQLVELAGDLPVSAYIKHVVLSRGEPVRRIRKVTADRELAARALAILGRSSIGASLSRLADHAATGTLELDDWTWTRIHEACEDVQAVRELLMEALGKKPERSPSGQQSASHAFAQSAPDGSGTVGGQA